jgi:hypothetical protein
MKVIEQIRILIGVSHAHQDDAYQRRDGESGGNEDTRETTGFAHVCDCCN